MLVVGLVVGINNSSLCVESSSPGPPRPYYAASVLPSLAAALTSTTAAADLTSILANFHFFPISIKCFLRCHPILCNLAHLVIIIGSWPNAVVPTKKNREIAVIFLHSSLTAQNWAINSGLTAPLSHPAQPSGPSWHPLSSSTLSSWQMDYPDQVQVHLGASKCKEFLTELTFKS